MEEKREPLSEMAIERKIQILRNKHMDSEVKVCGQPLRRLIERQAEQLCGKVDHIPVLPAGETIIVVVCHIQAGVPVVVKGTKCFVLPVDRYPVPFRSFPTAHAIFDVLKKVHAVSSVK